jgi:hypothetical protein
MRVLCGIDLLAGSGAGLVRRVQGLAAGAVDALILVHVIDPGPRRDVERQFAVRRLLAHPGADSARTQAMAAAEEAAGREALAEAAAAATSAASLQRRG